MKDDDLKDWDVYEDTNGKFGIVGVTGSYQGYAELSEEHARLMAAAPELLEALEAIIESVDAGSCAMLTHLQWAARAAIAKATGVEQ